MLKRLIGEKDKAQRSHRKFRKKAIKLEKLKKENREAIGIVTNRLNKNRANAENEAGERPDDSTIQSKTLEFLKKEIEEKEVLKKQQSEYDDDVDIEEIEQHLEIARERLELAKAERVESRRTETELKTLLHKREADFKKYRKVQCWRRLCALKMS